MTRVLKSYLFGGGPVTAVVRPDRSNAMDIKELRQSLRSLAINYELGPAAEYIVEQAAPCVRFRDLGQWDDAPIGSTRFGGDPDLPAKSPWPTDPGAQENENALLFIAQLNLEELPLWRGCTLPERGLLSIFLGINGFQGDAYVTYSRSTTRLVRQPTPVDRLVEDYRHDDPLLPCRAEPFLGLSLPATLSRFRQNVEELFGGEEELEDQIDDIDDCYKGMESEGPEFFAQLLGFAVPPYFPENDYHDQASARRLGVDAMGGPKGRSYFDLTHIKQDSDRKRVEDDAFRYPLLLSMGSENSTGAMWSDAGLLYILCHEDQIKSSEFGRVPSFIYH